MRGDQPPQFDLKPWQNRIISQLKALLGVREQPPALHDILADIRTRLASHETLVRHIVEAVDAWRLPGTASTVHSPAHPAFEFSDITKPPVINGKIKPRLTVTQHDVLMELLKAGPGGLTLEELDEKSDHYEARKTLKKLARDADWKSVIIFPGKKCQGGYRLRFS